MCPPLIAPRLLMRLLPLLAASLLSWNLCAQTVCTDCLAGPAVCNGSVTGYLEADDCFLDDGTFIDAFTLVLDAPATVPIAMNSTDVDCYLFLLDSSCNVLTSNDDCSGSTLNSCITRALAAGTYYVAPNSYDPSEGSYTLSVSGCVSQPAPSLSIQRQGPNVRVSWPVSATGFVLDQSPMVPGGWSQVPFPYVTNATEISITAPANVGNSFFQLRRL